MNSTLSLTLSTIDSQLEQTNQQLEALQQQIAETKAIRKAIAAKKRLAEKAFNQLSKAIEGINAVVEQLGTDGTELQKAAINAVSEYLPVTVPAKKTTKAKRTYEICTSTVANLVEFPKKKNDSNEFFTWQPTVNDQVSNFFNVAKGVVQATYIGSNNKSKLQAVGNKLTEYLQGISFEVRTAQRLDYTYELKIKGLNDDDIGWLTAFDFNQSFTAQLFQDLGDCPIDSLQGQSVLVNMHFKAEEVPTDYRLTDNPIAAAGAIVVERSTGDKYHLHSIEPDGAIGVVKGANGNKMFVYTDLFQIDREFADTANGLKRAILACRTKKDFELVKTNNLVDADYLEWVYKNLEKKDKARIKAICNPNQKTA